MTLSNPLQNLSEVPTELGLSPTDFDLGQHAVRALAGDPDTGPFNLNDLAGKSAYTPMSPNIGGNQGGSGTTNSNTFSLACAPNGGQAPYSYAWSLFGTGGAGTAAFSGSTTNQTAFAVLNVTGGLGANVNCNVKCTVTDAHSNVVDSNTVMLSWTFI